MNLFDEQMEELYIVIQFRVWKREQLYTISFSFAESKARDFHKYVEDEILFERNLFTFLCSILHPQGDYYGKKPKCLSIKERTITLDQTKTILSLPLFTRFDIIRW